MAEEENKKDPGIFRKVLGFFGEVYFRIINHPYLSERYTLQLNTNAELSGKVGELAQRVSNLSGQYEKEKEKAERSSLENQGRINTITQLSDVVNELINSAREINEQRDCLAEELVRTQEQLQAYQQGVLGSPEYRELGAEKAELKTKIEGLEKKVCDLDKLCLFRQETIKELRVRLREHDKIKIKQEESSYEQRAENQDKDHSYVVIGGHSRIVASTPEFRKDFGYTDSNKPVKGRLYFNVLKMPSDSPDYISPKKMKELLKDPEEIKLTTTIIDGKGEEKIIRFIKHKPDDFQVGNYRYFYTRVDIYEIGFVERKVGKILRTLHIIDRHPKTVSEFLKQKAINDIKEETDMEKDKILSRQPEEQKPKKRWGIHRKKQEKTEDKNNKPA